MVKKASKSNVSIHTPSPPYSEVIRAIIGPTNHSVIQSPISNSQTHSFSSLKISIPNRYHSNWKLKSRKMVSFLSTG